MVTESDTTSKIKNKQDLKPYLSVSKWQTPRLLPIMSLGGGGHCLVEGRYPLPNYRPCFLHLSCVYSPLIFRIIEYCPPPK